MAAHQVNICFHGIGVPNRDLEPGEDVYWISPEFFVEVLDYLTPHQTVNLSFDDGNDSDVEIALPALRERHLVGSFFPLAARIGHVGSVDQRGLRALRDNAMTIGSHGLYHRRWRGLDREDLDAELVTARGIIEKEAGVRVTRAACPLGSYDRRTLRRLRTLKYTQVFTSDRTTASRGAWLQPRYSIRNTDSLSSVGGIVEQGPGPVARLKSTARLTAKRLR